MHETVAARALVNAAGPWISEVMARRVGADARSPLRLVKGSHIVVPKLFDHDRAYIFQNADRRIVFAIPYEQDFTLIGTTDVDFDGDLDKVDASRTRRSSYLCRAANDYFIRPIAAADVVWTYAGVRPLYDEGDVSAHEATRDFVLELEGRPGEPPLLNIFGGKITTYRHLAEEALKKLASAFPDAGPPWTRGSALPGGDFRIRPAGSARPRPGRRFRRSAMPPSIASPNLRHHRQGHPFRRAQAPTSACSSAPAFTSARSSISWNEWAMSADDILWRRTKLGLHMSNAERGRLSDWLATRDQVSSLRPFAK